MTETTTFLSRKIGSAGIFNFQALVFLVVSASCNSKISSKLEASRIIAPADQGSEIEKEGVKVSVPPGTFSGPVAMKVEPTLGGVEISTVTNAGSKVLSADVLKDLHFCALFDPSYEQSKVYVLVKVVEGESTRKETIPNSALEFSEVSGKPQACWLSKYVNASFQIAVDNSPAVALKLSDPNCVDPDLSRLANDEALTLCDGTIATGSLDLANLRAENVRAGVLIDDVIGTVVPSPGKCQNDAGLGCVTTGNFLAADKKSFTAADIKVGKTIAGIAGTYAPDFPDAANVYNDTVNGVAGTLTLPSAVSVRTGNGVFGPAGTGVTPTLGDCAADGGVGCVAVAGFKAADMTNVVAAKIKSGVTIAAVVGDYPSATYPLAGADATADLDFATFDAKIKAATNFEWFDSSGTRYANSGDADIVAGNIVNTATIFGTLGTVAAPVAPDPWDVRVGQTINGIAGKLKVACRNSANTAVFDAGVFKNATADNTTDFFTVTAHGYADNDKIRFTAQTAITGLTATTTDYFVRFSTANTFQLATTSGGAAINFTTNGAGVVVYKWNDGTLDIWDTVDDYNNNGAAFTAAATPAAWTSDNFCGGAGIASSTAVWTDTTSDGTCDTAGDECRFKDKISGLEWSEFQSASAAWGTAMTTCGNLSFGGAGAWRLPTQKELMAAYEHGIYTAPNANWLTKAQMDANYFWSSSTVSYNTTNARIVGLSNGFTYHYGKTDMYQVLCVR
jgi:hypothetical protein